MQRPLGGHSAEGTEFAFIALIDRTGKCSACLI
jgi:hypothetical protein